MSIKEEGINLFLKKVYATLTFQYVALTVWTGFLVYIGPKKFDRLLQSWTNFFIALLGFLVCIFILLFRRKLIRRRPLNGYFVLVLQTICQSYLFSCTIERKQPKSVFCAFLILSATFIALTMSVILQYGDVKIK